MFFFIGTTLYFTHYIYNIGVTLYLTHGCRDNINGPTLYFRHIDATLYFWPYFDIWYVYINLNFGHNVDAHNWHHPVLCTQFGAIFFCEPEASISLNVTLSKKNQDGFHLTSLSWRKEKKKNENLEYIFQSFKIKKEMQK